MGRLYSALFRLFLLVAGLADRFLSRSHVDVLDRTDPYRQYERVRRNGPVVRSYMAGGWLVLGHAAVKEATTDPRFSVDVRKSPFILRMVRMLARGEEVSFLDHVTLLNEDPPDHTRLRKLARLGFLHGYVQSLEPNIRQLVDECLATVQGKGTFDLMETLAGPLPAFLISDILGVPRTDRVKFRDWSETIVKYARSLNYDGISRTNVAYRAVLDYLAHVVEEKRAHPADDLISHLIAAEEEGDKLSLEEVHATGLLLLIAGHETTTRLIGNAVYLLLTHPEQLELLRRSPDLLPNAIEETLRFEPPVQHTTRIALEDIDFHGCAIKQFQTVELIIGAANRDPSANERPNEFDIRRDSIEHVAFGYGPHLCLGAALARLEATTALEMLLARYPNLRLESQVPAWGDSDFMRGLDELIVSV